LFFAWEGLVFPFFIALVSHFLLFFITGVILLMIDGDVASEKYYVDDILVEDHFYSNGDYVQTMLGREPLPWFLMFDHYDW
jgi:hypothetical protein